MINKKAELYWLLTVLYFFIGVAFIYQQYSFFKDDIFQANSSALQKNLLTSPIKREKPKRQVVKGLYLTAYSANNPTKLDEIIKLVDDTELNAIVIDIKDYTGNVLYDSKIPLVNDLGLKDIRLSDPGAIVKKLHDHGIYAIARQTVFQDPVLAEKKPEWAIQNKKKTVWRDKKGLAWVDPTKKDVWQYDMQIAKEAALFGFDEINFDYVRFPSDGNMSDVAYSTGKEKKYSVMNRFYAYVNKQMQNQPVLTSFDMFGFVMEKSGEDDMNIGQRLVDAVNNVDYVCPMMYPSHYPSGHLGLDNPAAYPGKVIENGMKKGMPQFKNARAEARPWIQDFNIGAVYDAEKIRDQIDMVEKYSNAGWLLWNASNRYSTDGLKANYGKAL